nr:MAG TPA: hypothetical protein [Crassvirales sp.]
MLQENNTIRLYKIRRSLLRSSVNYMALMPISTNSSMIRLKVPLIRLWTIYIRMA